MLPLALIKEVRQLLDEGELSHRKIADKLGISRGTVGAVAGGRRAIHGREPKSPDELMLCCLEMPPERCLGCGATVYKPCVLCCARRFQSRQKLIQHLQSRHRSPRRRVA